MGNSVAVFRTVGVAAMSLNDVFLARSEPWWMNEHPLPYRDAGNSPRTELRAVMCCNKCEEKVREEISEAYGVEEIFTDQTRSKVVVYGYVDKHDVLKKTRNVDKRADIVSSDSFTFYHDNHSKHRKHHKHSQGYFFDNSRGHIHNRTGNHLPIFEVTGSPRYNSSFVQSSSYDNISDRRHSSYYVPGYQSTQTSNNRLNYKPDSRYRHLNNGYQSEPENRYRYHDYESSEYGPQHDHRYRYGYSGYKPSQSYPPSYVERDYRGSPYPLGITNPTYIKHIKCS